MWWESISFPQLNIDKMVDLPPTHLVFPRKVVLGYEGWCNTHPAHDIAFIVKWPKGPVVSWSIYMPGNDQKATWKFGSFSFSLVSNKILIISEGMNGRRDHTWTVVHNIMNVMCVSHQPTWSRKHINVDSNLHGTTFLGKTRCARGKSTILSIFSSGNEIGWECRRQ